MTPRASLFTITIVSAGILAFAVSAAAQDTARDDEVKLKSHEVLVKSMLSDGKITAEERRTLKALQAATSQVTVEAESGEQEFQPLSERARYVIEIFTGDVNLRDYWLAEPLKMYAIARASMFSDRLSHAYIRFLAQTVIPEVKKSSITNNYRPLRDILSRYKASIQPLLDEPETYRSGRALIFEAVKMIDGQVMNDRLPDATYNKFHPSAPLTDPSEQTIE